MDDVRRLTILLTSFFIFGSVSVNARLMPRSKFNRFLAFVFSVTVVENLLSHREGEKKESIFTRLFPIVMDTRHQLLAENIISK